MDEDLLSAYLDGELIARERAEVDAQADADADVRRALDEVAEVRALVRALPVPVPPAGFLGSLTEIPDEGAGETAPVVALAADRRRRWPTVVAAGAAAAAVLLAVVVPGAHRSRPPLATEVQVHQAGAAANGDPVSGLAPLATPLGFGR